MTGPQHLWSGNWEEDSASTEDDLAERRVIRHDPEPSPPPAQPKDTEPPAVPARSSPARRRSTPAQSRRRRRIWILGGSLVVIVIAVAVAAIALGGSSAPRTAAITPSTPAPSLAATSPAPAATQPSPSSPPIEWLGMELVSVPPGGATVDTVRLGSVGDRAGLSPGDVILSIDNRNLTDASDIAKAIGGLHGGDRVELQVSHGSELFQTTVTLGASPTRYP